MLKFLREYRSMRADVEALKAVLHETRLATDSTFHALAGVLSHIPEIAEDLRVAAGLMLDAPVTETDPYYRQRVVVSREASADLLVAMAVMVERNIELASRVKLNTGGGIQ